jgi:sulfonate transport system permease protein
MDLVLFGVIVIGVTGWALNALARAVQRRWFTHARPARQPQ